MVEMTVIDRDLQDWGGHRRRPASWEERGVVGSDRFPFLALLLHWLVLIPPRDE